MRNYTMIYLVKWYCGLAMWDSTFIGKKSLDEFVSRNKDCIVSIKEVRKFEW